MDVSCPTGMFTKKLKIRHRAGFFGEELATHLQVNSGKSPGMAARGSLVSQLVHMDCRDAGALGRVPVRAKVCVWAPAPLQTRWVHKEGRMTP